MPAPLRILIIDDNPADRLMYRHFLEEDISTRYHFLEASDGAEGIALYEAQTPDCVLLDYILHDMEGIDILTALVARRAPAPVIMLTGQGSADIAVRLMKSGAQDYLSKDSITPSLLQRAVHNTVERVEMQVKIRRTNEELVVAKDKAEAANRAKSDFLANMSHEMRTPMNAIIGLAHLLQRKEYPPERQREYLSTMLKSADTLLALINDTLDLSKIESRALQIEHIPFDLKAVVEEIAEINALQCEQKGLAFSLRYDPSLPRLFLGDPLRVRQILHNLLSNAIKFTEAGTIRLEVGGALSTKNTWRLALSVADTGIGIAPEKIETMFEKFTQADASTTRRYGGTGLGLSISRSLAEMMDGTIGIESRLGEGSVFTLTLPLPVAPTQESSADAGPAPDPVAVKLHILVVEDHPTNVLVITEFLQGFGFTYAVVESGAEALERLSVESFDLVLLDIQMPGMDGYEVARRIRLSEKKSGRAALPLIATTAHAFSDDEAYCRASGMSDYIAKPFDAVQLHRKIMRQIHLR